jgi:hypothetical protein
VELELKIKVAAEDEMRRTLSWENKELHVLLVILSSLNISIFMFQIN